jgi:hypothetical protein
MNPEPRFNIFVETEKGKVPVQQAQSPPANATASISDLVIVPKPEIKQMVYEGDKGETVNGMGWNGVEELMNVFSAIYYKHDKYLSCYSPIYLSKNDKSYNELNATKSIHPPKNITLNKPNTYFDFAICRGATEGEINSLISMNDYIGMVKEIESEIGEEKATDLVYVITQFRRSFKNYNTDNWNKFLIKDTKPLELSELNQSKISSKQTIVLPDNFVIDIGHIFTSLDAGNHLHPFSPDGSTLFISRNIDAVSWVGDLGSVLGEIYLTDNLTTKSTAAIQQLIYRFCSQSDLLGDIDGIVINYLKYQKKGLTLSELLYNLYLRNDFFAKTRFNYFGLALGLQIVNGKIINLDSWLESYEEDIAEAGQAYAASKKKFFAGKLVSSLSIAEEFRDEFTIRFLKSFILSLEKLMI